MSEIIEIPFNSGQDEGADKIMLPEGILRLMQNCRLSRDGRVEVRPQHTLLGDTVFTSGGGVMRAWDLATFEDKLIAYGSPGTAQTYPKDIFTYLGSGANAVWKGLFDDSVSYAALPVVTDLEIYWQAPAGFYADSQDVAYSNGHTCVCMTSISNTTAKVFVIKEGVVLQTETFSSVRSARVVAVGNVFVLLTRTTGNDVEGRQFSTIVNTVWSSAATLSGLGAGAITGAVTWDACSVPGSTTDWLVAIPRAGTPRMEVRRYNINNFSSATVWTNTSVGVAVGNCGICADSTSNSVGFAYISAANNVVLYTIVLSTGAAISGPTNVIGPATSHNSAIGAPALSIISTTAIAVQCQTSGGTGGHSTFSTRDITGHALVSTGVFDNVRMTSKLFNVERTSTLKEPYGMGTLETGNVSANTPLFSSIICGSVSGYLLEARWNYSVAAFEVFQAVPSYHGRTSVATDSAGQYWAAVGITDENTLGETAEPGTVQLIKFKAGSAARKQSAEMQGALYISGGFVGYYDGTFMVESGFLDTPQIDGLSQGTTGNLTQLATYSYICVYEWTDAKGRLHRSTPSVPSSVTLTGVNDDITITVTGSHTIRNIDYQGSGSLVQSVVYRNTPDDSVFYRVDQAPNVTGEAGYGDDVSLLDIISDTNLEVRPVIYTQSQKPVVNVAFPPCKFISAGRDRLIMGGLPDPYVVVFSQLPFPREPMEGADFDSDFAYQARLPEKVTAVSGFGDTYLAFTAEGIYEIPGAGPQRNGTGEFFTPRSIYADGGCIDWRSLVDTRIGLFFQMATDKLYLIDPSGTTQWIGRAIQDTLSLYPVIKSACLLTKSQRVVFAVVNSDTSPTDGGLLVYDIERKAWSFDNVGVVLSAVEYDGRLAYINGSNLVLLEDSAIAQGASALPTMRVDTGSIKIFKAFGFGTICKIGLLGTYLGDCTIEGFISYNDGADWTSLGTQAVTTANLFNQVDGTAIASGDPVTIIFDPKRRDTDRFSLRFDITNASNTGGMRLHMLSLEVEGQTNMTRQPARNRK